MNENEYVSMETAMALFEHSKAVAARSLALEVMSDALIATLGKSLPPLLPVLQENLMAIADAMELEMEEDTRASFRSHIASMDRKIERLK